MEFRVVPRSEVWERDRGSLTRYALGCCGFGASCSVGDCRCLCMVASLSLDRGPVDPGPQPKKANDNKVTATRTEAHHDNGVRPALAPYRFACPAGTPAADAQPYLNMKYWSTWTEADWSRPPWHHQGEAWLPKSGPTTTKLDRDAAYYWTCFSGGGYAVVPVLTWRSC